MAVTPVLTDHDWGNHRIVHELGIAYDDDTSQALTHLEAVAAETDGVLAEPPPVAYLDELSDEAVTLRVYYWISDPTRREVFEVRSAYARAVKDRLECEGVTVSPAAEHDLQGRLDITETGRGGSHE